MNRGKERGSGAAQGHGRDKFGWMSITLWGDLFILTPCHDVQDTRNVAPGLSSDYPAGVVDWLVGWTASWVIGTLSLVCFWVALKF